MQVSRIPCPHCFVELRIRDRSFLGKEIRCPECQARLEVVADGPKKLDVRSIPADDAGPATQTPKRRRKRSPSDRQVKSRAQSRAKQPTKAWLGVMVEAMKSPVVISWLAAGIAAVTLTVVAINRSSHRAEITGSKADEQTSPTKPPDEPAPPKKRVPLPAQPVVARKPKSVPPIAPGVIEPPIIVGRSPVEARRPLPQPSLPPMPPTPRIDIAAALSQRILLFEHKKGAPLKTILSELEEMAGVPVTIDPAVETGPTSPLNDTVVIKLEKTTLGHLLSTLLAKSGLTYAAEDNRIRIHPATAKTQAEEENAP